MKGDGRKTSMRPSVWSGGSKTLTVHGVVERTCEKRGVQKEMEL